MITSTPYKLTPQPTNQSKIKIPIIRTLRTIAKQKHTQTLINTFINVFQIMKEENNLFIVYDIIKSKNYTTNYDIKYAEIDPFFYINEKLGNNYYPHKLFSIKLGYRKPTFINQYIQSLIQAKKEAASETLDFIHSITQVSNRKKFYNDCFDFFNQQLETKINNIVEQYKQSFNTNQNTYRNIMNRTMTEHNRKKAEYNRKIKEEELRMAQLEINAEKWAENYKLWQKTQTQSQSLQIPQKKIRRQQKINQHTKYKKPYTNYHTNSNYNISGSSGYASTQNEGYWTNNGNRPEFVKTGTIKKWKNKKGSVLHKNNPNYVHPIITTLPK